MKEVNEKFEGCIGKLIARDEDNYRKYLRLKNSFTHIHEKLVLFYGTILCEKYLESILFTCKMRDGFPYEIFCLLKEIMEENQKYLDKRFECVWDINLGR